jgi:hypothetical protein
MYPQQVSVTLFLEYAPEFPGVPNPQQHMWPGDPPAPHTSMMAVPD